MRYFWKDWKAAGPQRSRLSMFVFITIYWEVFFVIPHGLCLSVIIIGICFKTCMEKYTFI